MIVPSIDIKGGHTVQLVGGERQAIDAGDPVPIATHFSRVGEIAVIDLDAAMGNGNNREIIQILVQNHHCRVGGGIRDYDSAVFWLDAGAEKIILGTAARPELLNQLPKDRLIAALDTRHGEVVIDGWKTGTGRNLLERIAELKDHVGGFLVTFVEREGRMEGIDLGRVREVVKAAAPVKVTVAGGVTTSDEIAAIDEMGADAQVGMALYSGRLDLAKAFLAPMKSDRTDGLWPTVVVDELGSALGLVYSDTESVKAAVDRGQGIYHSRSRGLWVKGESSGNTQDLLRIEVDCDRDSLRFTVRQSGGNFCHTGTRSCFNDDRGLLGLSRLLSERKASAPEGSYTRRLFNDPALLRAKLIEEAGELADAFEPGHIAEEAADVLFFTFVALARSGVGFDEVTKILDRRGLKVTRRPGNAKVK